MSSDKVYFGIDLVGTSPHAVALADGQMRELALPNESRYLSVLFDPYGNVGNLGVGFPTLMQFLGGNRSMTVDQRVETADTVFVQILAALRGAAEGMVRRPVNGTALVVPSALSNLRRQALLNAARSAGLTDASLIDRCTAAAIGQRYPSEEARTVMVLDVEHGDAELALLRLVRNRCRTLASTVLTGVSGEVFDAALMEMMVLDLRGRKIFMGLTKWTSAEWLAFRSLAEQARHALSSQAEIVASLVPQLTGQSGPVQVTLERDAFHARVGHLIERTLAAIGELLDTASIEPGDLDTVLASGVTAQQGPIAQALSEAFGEKLLTTPGQMPALGGAWYARCLAAAPAPPEAAAEDLSMQRRKEEPAAAPEPAPVAPTGLEAVRALIAQKRHTEAAALLDAIAREVEELRRQLEQSPGRAIESILQQAQRLLDLGRYEEAVEASHRAYQQAPSNPEVFLTMMRLHAESGLAMSQPEQYNRAISILNCAHHHDRTDRSIHKAMAQRHFMHAVAMRSLSNVAQAMELLRAALTFDPKHQGANDLLRELNGAASAGDGAANDGEAQK